MINKILLFLFCITMNITISQNNNSKKKKQVTSQKSYKIENEHGRFTVYIQDHFVFDKIGYASYYTVKSSSSKTAIGTIYRDDYWLAAHPYLKLPCIARITRLHKTANGLIAGKSILVKVVDRGPFTKYENRIVDVSKSVADELGFVDSGVALVRVEVLQEESMELIENGGNLAWNGEPLITK